MYSLVILQLPNSKYTNKSVQELNIEVEKLKAEKVNLKATACMETSSKAFAGLVKQVAIKLAEVK